MTRPVILVDDTASSFEVYPSVVAAAAAINRHPSTVHRALTGSRGIMTVGSEQLLALDYDVEELAQELA